MSTTLWRTILATLTISMFAGSAIAQRGARVDQRRITLSQMMTLVDVELDDVAMEDFVVFMKGVTNADLSPYWASDSRPSGLVKDARVTINARNITALDLMERVLERPGVISDEFDEATWQMSPSGAFEFGPRSRLNRRTKTVIYDVRDLTFIFNDNQPPQSLDLDSALDGGQGGGAGGGGGGSGLFGGGGGGGDDDIELGGDSDELLDELIDIIVTEIEPDQWEITTGEGASLRVFRGDLLIRAPDYIHRQLNGYTWWPRSGFSARQSARVDALREYGVAAINEGNATYEPNPAIFDEDGVYVRVEPMPEAQSDESTSSDSSSDSHSESSSDAHSESSSDSDSDSASSSETDFDSSGN